jgi:hypothetical protein
LFSPFSQRPVELYLKGHSIEKNLSTKHMGGCLKYELLTCFKNFSDPPKVSIFEKYISNLEYDCWASRRTAFLMNLRDMLIGNRSFILRGPVVSAGIGVFLAEFHIRLF